MLDNMDQRSRLFLVFGFVAALVILMGYFLQVQSRKERVLKRQIAAALRDIDEIREMGGEIQRIKKQVEKLPGLKTGRQIELFSILEKEMKGLGIQKGDMRIRPLAASGSDDYIEKSVEVKANKITLQTLVDLLYAVQQHPKGLRIVALKVDKRYDNETLLDASFKVSMFYAPKGE